MKINTGLRRILLISLFGCFTVTFSYGQAALIILILGDKVATENLHLSIDGAINLSTLSDIEGAKISPGVNFGLGIHIKLNDKWTLRPELKFLSRSGSKGVEPILEVPEGININETKFKLNYLDIPVFLKYKITPQFFLSAGPQISFLTMARQISEGTLSGSSETTVVMDIQPFFSNIDLSIPVEAGYTLNLATKKTTTKMKVHVFVRYIHGFMEVFEDPAIGSARNSTFQFGLSIPFIKSAEELAKSQKN